MIKINDSRTIVTEILLEESNYADGTKRHFVAYRVKGNSSSMLVSGGSGYSYSSLRQVDEDHVEALAENGDWHVYTIGVDGVWSGLQRGFTKAQSASGKADKKADKKADNKAKEEAKAADKASKRAKRGAIINFILDEIPEPLNWAIYPVWWIISAIFKLIWWLIKLLLVIVTFGWASEWFDD